MRRKVCTLLIALALFTGCAALAETDFDFSGLSLEELLVIREQLDAEIQRLTPEDGEKTYESGVYLVGRDIPEGLYVLTESADALFASVLVRAGEDESSPVLTYSLINAQAVIRLRADTWLTLTEARAWTLESAPARGIDGRVVHEGSYLVGAQIPAGRYVASIVEKAPLPSYSVYSDVLGTDAQLIKFEVLHDDAPVDLREGDYIELSGCILTVEDQF